MVLLNLFYLKKIYHLIDSFTTIDNDKMKLDSIEGIDWAEGAQGKRPLGYLIDIMRSKFLDSLSKANIRLIKRRSDTNRDGEIYLPRLFEEILEMNGSGSVSLLFFSLLMIVVHDCFMKPISILRFFSAIISSIYCIL